MDGVDVELLYKLLMGDLRFCRSGHRFVFVVGTDTRTELSGSGLTFLLLYVFGL